MEENMNNELAQIMLTELNEFRASLLAMPPEEILKNAWIAGSLRKNRRGRCLNLPPRWPR